MAKNNFKHILSKSTFLRGLQCLKSLYLNRYHPELRDELSEAREGIFQQGKDFFVVYRETSYLSMLFLY